MTTGRFERIREPLDRFHPCRFHAHPSGKFHPVEFGAGQVKKFG